MHLKYLVLIISTFLVGLANGLAQPVSDDVDLADPDLKKLESLTFQAVNDLRKEKRILH